MQKSILVVIALLYHSHNGTCFSILNFLSEGINSVTHTISDFFNDIRNSIYNFFSRRLMKEVKQSIMFDPESKKRLNYKQMKSTPQIAAEHGWEMESHKVLTVDRYILTLHRIRPSSTYKNTALGNRTVLLHHGLLGSSADWILLGPNKSLPYILSEEGYDVWLANARGNRYSRTHESLRSEVPAFWNFSFEDIGKYDLPAMANYIRKLKNSTECINYIGHSMGASALLVLLSLEPQYNEYFSVGILLAPMAFMTQIRGPLNVVAHMISNDPYDSFLEFLGKGEYVPSRNIPLWLVSKYCEDIPVICTNPLLFLSGGLLQKGSRDANFIAQLLYHVPAGGSTKTILHYARLINSGAFHKFDDTEIAFDLSQITLPIALFSSSDDWLATVDNVQRLYLKLSNSIGHVIIEDKQLSHTEFVWGFEANNLIFDKVVDLLKDGIKLNDI